MTYLGREAQVGLSNGDHIDLISVDSGADLNIIHAEYDDFSGSFHSICTSADEARALRDALIRIYPLNVQSPQPTTNADPRQPRIGQRVRVRGDYKGSPSDFNLVGRVGIVQDELFYSPNVAFDGLKSGHNGPDYGNPGRKDTWSIPRPYLELVEGDISDEKKFWALSKSSLNESEWVESLRHPTKEEAEKEATKRVSRYGGTYYVLECVGVVKSGDVKFESVA